MIKAITFDLWNTILVNKSYTQPRLDILDETLASVGKHVDRDILKSSYDVAQVRHDELWEKDQCHYPLLDRVESIIRGAGVEVNGIVVSDIARRFNEVFLDDPPELTHSADETIKLLSTRFRLGIISDTGVTLGSYVRKLLDRYNLLRCFTATVFSDEIGVCKPNQEVFAAALRLLGCKPSETLHVGDLLRTDVEGARMAGMKTAWLRVREADAVGVEPDFTIIKLKDLLEISEVRIRL